MGIKSEKSNNMNNKKALKKIDSWFEHYVAAFQSDNQAFNQNIAIKVAHSRRVCDEMSALAESLSLSPQERHLSQIIALLHDVGRFRQYAEYGTFADRKSTNHATLGVTILKENGVLDNFDNDIRSLILRTITYHNRIDLPEGETDTCLFFVKMLRDADKIDIWHVVTSYYDRADTQRNRSIELDLPDTMEVSPPVLEDILSGRVVKVGNMKTLNDFKLLQMSWVYDINFPYTFTVINKRKYLEKLRDAITDKPRARAIYAILRSYFERCL